MVKQGNIKISSENMMPIIKKWLYSEKDIFLREIVANGSDAITKLKKLVSLGEAEVADEDYQIRITVDKDGKTLTVSDNGIGMTEEEVEKYITQIAFSGAADFAEKYEKANGAGIIGHFGLGFYSAYMVSDNVEIYTKSYTGAPAVHWESDGEDTYTIENCDKAERGTTVVMHVSDDEAEFLEEFRIKELIAKYLSFMPYPIYLGDNEKALNETLPLYAKNPSDCTDEEYKEFYRTTFADYDEPLFWVHLNMDYPYRVKGILYFPKVKNKVELEKGKVKLYCNQVFVADNIKEVIPEFLMLLNGVIDCPDIPLNVSRSFLQNDRQVQKISKHITKKVADKLTGMFKNEREAYESCWKDVATFAKYGCMKEADFYEKVKDVLIFKDTQGQYRTLNEHLGISDDEELTEAKTVYYVSDEVQQAQYIRLFNEASLKAIVCDTFIDSHFMSFLEFKSPKKVKFMRIDADIDGALKSDEDSLSKDAIVDCFKNALADVKVQIKAEAFKNESVPAVINVSEMARRYAEMSRYYGMESEGLDDLTLVLNTSSPIVSSILTASDEKKTAIAKQVYYLALLSNQKLNAKELEDFTASCLQILNDYTHP